MEIEHLCLFKLKPDTTDSDKAFMIQSFLRLKGVIPGLLEVSIGENVTEETEYAHGYNLGMRMRFQSHEHLRNYLLHPEHVKVSQFVFSKISEVSVCDFYVREESA